MGNDTLPLPSSSLLLLHRRPIMRHLDQFLVPKVQKSNPAFKPCGYPSSVLCRWMEWNRCRLRNVIEAPEVFERDDSK